MTKHRAKRRSLRHQGVKVLALKDGRYVARWNDPLSGKQQQQSLDKLNLTNDEARRGWARTKSATVASLRATIAAGGAVATRTTLEDALKTYFERFGNRGTRINKERPLKAFSAWLDKNGVRTVQAIASTTLSGWRDHVLKPDAAGHAMSTRNRWLVATRIFLNWSSGKGWLPLVSRDAIRDATKRAPEPVHEIQFLRPEQLRQLLDAVLRHDAAEPGRAVAPFVLGLLCSGMRFAEAQGLLWSEVDLPENVIRLPATRTKTKRARTITLAETPSLLALLRAMSLRRGGRELVFNIANHREWQAAQERLVATYGAPSGLTAHALRRTCGTILTNAPIFGSASAWASAKRLGHSVTLAEAAYAGALHGLPATARTLEQAAGIETQANAIVAAVGGAVEPATAVSATRSVSQAG